MLLLQRPPAVLKECDMHDTTRPGLHPGVSNLRESDGQKARKRDGIPHSSRQPKSVSKRLIRRPGAHLWSKSNHLIAAATEMYPEKTSSAFWQKSSSELKSQKLKNEANVFKCFSSALEE